MSIIKNRIKESIEKYVESEDIFQLCEDMIRIGNFSIRCESHAQLAYKELAKLKHEAPEHIPNTQYKQYVKAKKKK